MLTRRFLSSARPLLLLVPMLFVVNLCFVTEDVSSTLLAFQPTQLRLQASLQPNYYGQGLQAFFLGFLCVSPEFQVFAKPHRDRYTNDRKVQYCDGLEIVRERTFECEVALPYETVLIATPQDVVQLMSQEVLLAVERLAKHQSKLGAFDLAALRQDVTDCLMAVEKPRVEPI